MSNAERDLTEDLNALDGWELAPIVAGLRAARDHWRQSQQRLRDHGEREFPSREALRLIARDLCGVLFPLRLGPADLRREGEDFYVGHTLGHALRALFLQVQRELRLQGRQDTSAAGEIALDTRARELVRLFAEQLPAIRSLLDTDVQAAFLGDPAAGSVDEVLLCYPGVLAVIHHRLAHALYGLGLPLLARMLAELAHSSTGIDIHPGASIGGSFFIDHGTGVVIGETAVIGERVRIYQAVTLGAKSFQTDADGVLVKGVARHPRVGDDVVIYAGATILGRIEIGSGSVIGGNVWLTHPVPPGSHVSQAGTHQEVLEAGAGI